jgi:hypothetical protein
MAGVFLHKDARSLFKNTEFEGLMMGTTWAVMLRYVTSIRVVVKRNTVIPVAFSFGQMESSQSYRELYRMFQEKCDINMSASRSLRPRIGTSKTSEILRVNGNRRFLYLRHFLKTITHPRFSVDVKNLARCRTGKEDQRMITFSEPHLRNGIGNDAVRLSEAHADFAKARLVITPELSIVIDPSSRQRWEEVSQCVRVQWRMPSTTNSLESIHGHLNEATPRRNDFWASLKRLADHIDDGIKRWPEVMRHNFKHACRVPIDRIPKIGQDELQDQIRTFRSTSLDCPYGETVHPSGMDECPIPCCHKI